MSRSLQLLSNNNPRTENNKMESYSYLNIPIPFRVFLLIRLINTTDVRRIALKIIPNDVILLKSIRLKSDILNNRPTIDKENNVNDKLLFNNAG
jgi:hypothetical protein